MVEAYLLLITKPGTETEVAESLLKTKGVKEVSVVYGGYDIIAKLNFKSMHELQDFTLKIRKDKRVERTTTMISLHG